MGLGGSSSPMFSNLATRSMMVLLTRREPRRELEVSSSEIHPAPPLGLSLKCMKVGVDMVLDG